MSSYGNLTYKTVTIASGGSVSSSVDMGTVFNGSVKLVGLYMPAAWTAADIYFKGGKGDGSSLKPVGTNLGTEYKITPVAGWYQPVDSAAFEGINEIQIQSGPTGAEVAQGAARDVVLVFMYV